MDVRTSHVQRWLEQIALEDGISKTTLKHIKHLLSGIFRHAMQQDYFDSGRTNPVTAASIPADAPNGGETYAYSLEEITKMLNVLPEPAATVVATAAFTGLRRGEIRGLRWEDFEPAVGEKMAALTVNRSIWNGIECEPKTAKSKAPVPVIPALAARLELHPKSRNSRTGPIFTNKAGNPLDLNELYQHGMAKILRDSGMKWHGWHGFRRGLATNLHRWGVDDKTIQAILRHSNIATTQNVYIKDVPEQTVVAMKRLEVALSQRQAVN
jgi:integrase